MKAQIVKWLTEQFGDDAELHAELYGQYATEMKAKALELKAAFANGEIRAVAEIAHAMKGMALQMGDDELSGPCLVVQKEGEASKTEKCAELIAPICALVDAL